MKLLLVVHLRRQLRWHAGLFFTSLYLASRHFILLDFHWFHFTALHFSTEHTASRLHWHNVTGRIRQISS